MREMAAYAAVTCLLRTMSRDLNIYDVLFSSQLLETYQFATKELKSFQNFVERLDSRRRKRMNATLERITKEIREYNEEYLNYTTDEIEEFSGGIHSLVKKLKEVEEYAFTLKDDEFEDVPSPSRVVPKPKIAGLAQWRQLKEEFVDTFYHCPIFLIYGMVGIGKTTLTLEMYEDLDILELFDCRAWVVAGIGWNPEETTKAILAQVDPEAHSLIMGESKEKIVERLKESLRGKQYLIVLDDVWTEDIIDYLKSSFPDNQNKSRVIITSRMYDVARNDSNSVHFFSVRLLDIEESWDLLREKVFVGDTCPPHLEKAGKKIAEKCDGLPLTIVTIAGPLSKAAESFWINAAEKRKHQLFIDAYEKIAEVLFPSYEILSDELKVCFLYMGVFPQKYEIPKSRLFNLWIAENFITPESNEIVEYCALQILWEFDMCGILMVYQRGGSSKTLWDVKKCGLHSVWWHFCQIEARKTNCFHVLDCYNEEILEEGLKGQSRLSIHYNVLFAIKHVHNSIEDICASTARSLLCLGPYNQYMVPICFGLKLLQRLDALNIRFYDFPLEVLELVMLEYLALTCNEKLPPSISNLQKLQYLIVHPHLSIKSREILFNLPMEIWDMKLLKHLQVMGYDLPDLGVNSLHRLTTLSGVTTSSCTVLNRVRHLKKLRIKIELEPDVANSLPCFDHIFHLTELEKLKCVIVNPKWKFGVVALVSPFPCLPFSLTKLSLCGLGYPWKEMSNIASLPNLKILKLQCNAFRGSEWEVEENGFPNLRSLLIEDIDLVKLKWENGSFKMLENLTIKLCFKFEQLIFGDLPNILKIEVIDCNTSVEWFVKYNIMMGVRISLLSVSSSWKL